MSPAALAPPRPDITEAPPPTATPATAAKPMAVAATAAGYVGALHVVDPFQTHSVGCPFLGITGWWCPGCGASRAVYRISHGDLIGSLVYHPLMLGFVVLLGWWWAGWMVTSVRGVRPRWARSPTELPRGFVLAIAALFTSLWILRNFDAFAFLAPPT